MNFMSQPNRLSISQTSDWKNGPPQSNGGPNVSRSLLVLVVLVLFAGTLSQGATLCLFELP